uniref:Ig-like domain-containing protein n=1 Tax=Lepisosteus oculatus TaxID=7918 RepID=W5MPH8_LEPOC
MKSLIILVLVLQGVKGTPRVHVLTPAITALRGSDVRIDCQFHTSGMRKGFDVEWLQKRQERINSIHLFHQSPELSHVQDHSLTGRSRMFPSAIANGNASLLISNVEMTDEGEYTCFIVMDGAGYRDTAVLTVVASYEQPELQQVLEQEAVSLSCVSRKGFPAALVSWIDDRGGSYSQEAITELTLTPEGLYDAHSRLKRAFSSQRRVCCIITNSPLQERKRSCVQLGAGKSLEHQEALL